MAALSAASAKNLAATDTLAKLGLAQTESFEEAVNAFTAARKEQLVFNQATDTAIASLQDAVKDMRAQLLELRSNNSAGSSNDGDARPAKSSRTEFGNGGIPSPARKRGSSAQPQRQYDQAENLTGDPCVCHWVLLVDVSFQSTTYSSHAIDSGMHAHMRRLPCSCQIKSCSDHIWIIGHYFYLCQSHD
jgi:uncharacterized protein with von Willebrand factor type A (vWA) domain